MKKLLLFCCIVAAVSVSAQKPPAVDTIKKQVVSWEVKDSTLTITNLKDFKFIKIGGKKISAELFNMSLIFISKDFYDNVVKAIESSTAISSAEAKQIRAYIDEQLRSYQQK